MITAADFKIRFPEFSSVDDARIELFIDDAEIILNPVYWDTKYDMGLHYLTAHYLSLADKTSAGNSGATLPKTGQAVDGSSVTYAAPTIDDGTEAYYSATAYGQRYLALRKTLGVPAFSV